MAQHLVKQPNGNYALFCTTKVDFEDYESSRQAMTIALEEGLVKARVVGMFAAADREIDLGAGGANQTGAPLCRWNWCIALMAATGRDTASIISECS